MSRNNDGYQKGLASWFVKDFDKNSLGGGIKKWKYAKPVISWRIAQTNY